MNQGIPLKVKHLNRMVIELRWLTFTISLCPFVVVGAILAFNRDVVKVSASQPRGRVFEPYIGSRPRFLI